MYTKILLTALLVISFNQVNAQENVFRSGFVFKKKYIDNTNISIYKISEETDRTTGKLTKKFEKKEIYNKLIGVIKERNKDSLFVHFWDITKNVSSTNNIITSEDNGSDYVIEVKKWNGNRSHLDLPYRFVQLMATNIPFRVLTKSGNLESEFLNANVSLVWVKGKTRLFKSEFVEPRNRYWALGPYFGLTAIDGSDTEKKQFGLNYGVNVMAGIQGINIIAAYGFQNGFKSDTKSIQPYFGFGIGFKLLEAFSPQIKNKD
ncbi:hypothetical protein ACFSR6_21230 [Pedobacter vanadiisoli]|uniref:Outer membrane protein with beta-barrel domain n=1 Tax=Pedobacter vanadiisoli TaxID=1761975 RepID=A0ABW5MRC7_9SPHI